jgi:hypothetical protein
MIKVGLLGTAPVLPVICDMAVESCLRGSNTAGYQRLPSDPIGTYVLTLINVVPGSSILIEDVAETTQYYNGICNSSSLTLNLQAYAVGSPNNDLRIRVRKGSSPPYYRPYETQAVAYVGSQLIYVNQIQDD